MAFARARPSESRLRLVLIFRAGPDGPALAIATIRLAGREGVNLTTASQQQPPGLGPLDGGRSTAATALKIAGLKWNL